jgi:predicted RNA-binding Zn ribbon-like protein
MFTFHRGALALDFVGTLGARASEQPLERIPDAAPLSQWLLEAGLLDRKAAAVATASEYELAVRLREAMARVYGAVLDGRRPTAADVQTINEAAAGVTRGAPYLDQRRLVQRWRTDAPVRLALGRLAVDAMRVVDQQRDRLARCQRPDCGALLLSGDRGEKRRWCSMQSCGNRAKVAAYRTRRSDESVS